jgi:hypothetical protein
MARPRLTLVQIASQTSVNASMHPGAVVRHRCCNWQRCRELVPFRGSNELFRRINAFDVKARESLDIRFSKCMFDKMQILIDGCCRNMFATIRESYQNRQLIPPSYMELPPCAAQCCFLYLCLGFFMLAWAKLPNRNGLTF